MSSPTATDVRRTKSAAASVPTRAERTSAFLGAPPPYSQEDASRSNLNLNAANQFLSVPQVGSEKGQGHRRTTSESAVSTTTNTGSTHWTRSPHQRSTSNLTEQDRSYFYDEDYGYGVGTGRISMTMPQPQPARSNGTISPSASDYSEPETELVMSPTSVSVHAEDPLELLKRYKTVFVIDDSASMTGERWEEVSRSNFILFEAQRLMHDNQAREALGSLADIAAKYETDGFDIYFINARRSAQHLRVSAAISEMLSWSETSSSEFFFRQAHFRLCNTSWNLAFGHEVRRDAERIHFRVGDGPKRSTSGRLACGAKDTANELYCLDRRHAK